MPFCPGCGAEVIESAEICPHCGTRVKKQKKYPRMPNGDLITKEKSAGIAVILGLFIPGAGVMYGGRVGLGIVIFLLTVCLVWFWIGLIPWIYGICEGYILCKLNNALWYEYLENQ